MLKSLIYEADFMFFTFLTIILAIFTFRNGFSELGPYVFGIVLFTFAEYWVHRTLLHRFFYHGTHENHHLRPEEHVVIWYTPFIFAGFWLVLPQAVFAGFMMGYLWFITMHHSLHHWKRKPQWLKRYGEWHDLHHKNIRFNFGITHPLWDWVFGTYKVAK